MFTSDGEWIGAWGTQGDSHGEIDQPAGIAFDSEDNLYVVDTGNNRIQKFTKDGQFLAKWGQQGSGDGEFDMPWGIGLDGEDNVYIADWRNDRIQKFAPDGSFLMKFGESGSEDGQFNRPADVAVDKEGLIYVADWRNDRVQVFDADGRFITGIIGDATLSKWGITKLDANPDMKMQRDIAQGLEREKFLRGPMGVVVDDQDQVFIVDSQRNRIQIYRKIPPFFVGLYDGGRL
jgi:3-dehydroquinate synthase class II